MKTNAWVRITETLAQTWRTWALWYQGDRTEPEPPLEQFAKDILQYVIDWPFAFNAYKLGTIDTVQWRMGNFYHVTLEQMQEGYTVYPNEWEVMGLWTWESGDEQCQRAPEFPWDPAEALLFMPDKCVDPPDCTNIAPATEVTDVSLLAGQPPREFS